MMKILVCCFVCLLNASPLRKLFYLNFIHLLSSVHRIQIIALQKDNTDMVTGFSGKLCQGEHFSFHILFQHDFMTER